MFYLFCLSLIVHMCVFVVFFPHIYFSWQYKKKHHQFHHIRMCDLSAVLMDARRPSQSSFFFDANNITIVQHRAHDIEIGMLKLIFCNLLSLRRRCHLSVILCMQLWFAYVSGLIKKKTGQWTTQRARCTFWKKTNYLFI